MKKATKNINMIPKFEAKTKTKRAEKEQLKHFICLISEINTLVCA